MASLKTKFSVGLFMIVGIILAISVVIWLGVTNYLEKGLLYATYFDESVQGLDKDSPVKYRGVTIGKVHEISVAPDGELIQVLLKIENKPSLQRSREKIIAQLKSVGITGLMFIELDTRKAGLPDLSPKINFLSDYPVIATHPSDISLLFQSLDNVLAAMGAVDLNEMFQKIATTLNTINGAINKAQIGEISSQLQNTLNLLNQRLASEKWIAIMDSTTQAAERINTFSDTANMAVTRLDRTLLSVEQLVETNGPLIHHSIKELKQSITAVHQLIGSGELLIEQTGYSVEGINMELLRIMQRINTAVEVLNQFSERITAHPPQLLWGQPMPAKPSR
jgi:phospholipid/cholesterol/gamma-HCH transport system substrate-binding protein